MSKMNFSEWPVVDMMDFETVIIDATRWDNGDYTAMLNFYHTMAETEEERSTGFTLCTHIGGRNLREVYQKINAAVLLGLFDGASVDAHGTLWNEAGDEIDGICWHQYDDEEYDEDEDRVHLATHGAPATLQ